MCREEGDVEIEADIGMKQPQAMWCWQLPEAGTVKGYHRL